MNKTTILFCLLYSLLLLPACTSITEQECRSVDFYVLGYSDGVKGKPRNTYQKYYDKCLKYEVDIARELVMYDMGRERGLYEFCQENGFFAAAQKRVCERGLDVNVVDSGQGVSAGLLKHQANTAIIFKRLPRF